MHTLAVAFAGPQLDAQRSGACTWVGGGGPTTTTVLSSPPIACSNISFSFLQDVFVVSRCEYEIALTISRSRALAAHFVRTCTCSARP